MDIDKLRKIMIERLNSDGYDLVTRTDIFRNTGLSFATIKSFERGGNISDKTYEKLCEFLGVCDD